MKTGENTILKIILIGNYPKDRQISMDLFTDLLQKGFEGYGHRAEVWRPIAFFGALTRNSMSGAGKWLAYLDKWLLFPLVILLRRMSPSNNGSNVRFLVTDHSNSIYLKYLPNDKTVIACHDVLAIRGALGFKDAYCDASKFGVVLQKWILNGLLHAKKLATVSDTTLRQLEELDKAKNPNNNQRRVILNAFNEHFEPMLKSDALKMINDAGLSFTSPFILHIGSSLPRKNRKLLIEMLDLLKDDWNGSVVFAGQDLDSDLKELIQLKGLKDRVHVVIRPSYPMLNALYSACAAFVFPSFSEGFGWPVIEAQACGAPVIASNVQPMPEVGSDAALYGNPNSPEDFAMAFKSLTNEKLKSELVQKGFVNCNRFKPQRMIEEYINFLLENTHEKTT